jgi:GT2 family glycosyltransferase
LRLSHQVEVLHIDRHRFRDAETSIADKKKQPLVSVIILSWNARSFLEKCLDSVLKTDYPTLEVIVSDNGSSDGSPELVRQRYPSVILIENKMNLGFSEGNNVAIQHSSGDIVILLNQDTLVDKAWVGEIVKVAKEPSIGILGPKIYCSESNVIQAAGFYLYPSGHHLARGAFQEDVGQFDQVVDVDYVMGAALAIKRPVIERIGLLDPDFFAYYEEVDWCYRAKEVGYKVTVVPRASVYHYGSISWGRNPFKQMYLNERNRIRFIIKHSKGTKLLRHLIFSNLSFATKKARSMVQSDLFIQKQTTKGARKRAMFLSFLLNFLGANLAALVSTVFFWSNNGRRSISNSSSNFR